MIKKYKYIWDPISYITEKEFDINPVNIDKHIKLKEILK